MTYSLSLLWWWGGFPSWHCYRLPPVLQTHQRQKFNDVWLIPTSHWTYIHKCHNSYAINRNASGCNAAQDGLGFIWTSPGCERAGMIQKWRVCKFNNAQNKLKGRSLLLSFLFSYSDFVLLSPYAPKPFFLPPVCISSCSTLHTQLVLISGRWWWVGIRMEPLAGELCTHHTVVTNREKPHQTSSSAAAARQYISADMQILVHVLRG